MYQSYIDKNTLVTSDTPLAWLTTSSAAGHAYLFVEYVQVHEKKVSNFWKFFNYTDEYTHSHVIEIIDFIPGRVRHETFNVGNGETLKSRTYYKQKYSINQEQLKLIRNYADLAKASPPPYQRYSSQTSATASNLEQAQNCSTALVALLGSAGVTVNTGPLGKLVIPPIDLAGDTWSWICNLISPLQLKNATALC